MDRPTIDQQVFAIRSGAQMLHILSLDTENEPYQENRDNFKRFAAWAHYAADRMEKPDKPWWAFWRR